MVWVKFVWKMFRFVLLSNLVFKRILCNGFCSLCDKDFSVFDLV